MYFLYILQCADKSFYTGITTDVARRIEEHNTTELGARYTRGRRPCKVVFIKEFENRSTASSEEAHVKALSRVKKTELIKKHHRFTKVHLHDMF
ncbi:MAG: Endo/excinuclease amino terminal domain protein [Candidatus Moranbacteria bacterium GW2011_GWA2_39_41]|nr:MAG: Endo/excinuclease amino terminal domain protein [Candidatus Moranbacteria bacterium GW2011_GWA2_39_41]